MIAVRDTLFESDAVSDSTAELMLNFTYPLDAEVVLDTESAIMAFRLATGSLFELFSDNVD